MIGGYRLMKLASTSVLKEIPAHKIGRLWKFKISQVDAWVEADSTQETENNTD